MDSDFASVTAGIVRMGAIEMDSETLDRGAFALPELDYSEPPAGSDRRAFMMRSAMAAAIVAVGGTANRACSRRSRRQRRLGQQPSTRTLMS